MTPEQLKALGERLSEASTTPAKDIRQIEKHIGRMELILAAVIIVLFVGFFGLAVAMGGMYVEASRSDNSSYADLVNTMNMQDMEINAMLQALHAKGY